MRVLLRVLVAELLPSESELQRLQIRGCLILLVGQLIDGHPGEPLTKLPAGLTTDQLAFDLLACQAVQVGLERSLLRDSLLLLCLIDL